MASGGTADEGDDEVGVAPAVTVTKTVVGAVLATHCPACSVGAKEDMGFSIDDAPVV